MKLIFKTIFPACLAFALLLAGRCALNEQILGSGYWVLGYPDFAGTG